MMPYQVRFIMTATIDENGYRELLKAGYSESEIITFMKANCKHVIDWDKINIPIKDLDIESDDEYTIIRKPIPMKYSGFEGESNNVRTIKPTETVRDTRSRNGEELPITQREW